MYPPNYDLRGVQIVHEQHLKELREEAAAYHFAEELKRDEAAERKLQPSWIARAAALAQRLFKVISARGDHRAPSARQTRRKGFNNG